MFGKRDAAGFGLVALAVLVLNIVFWLALLAGALWILRAFGVL